MTLLFFSLLYYRIIKIKKKGFKQITDPAYSDFFLLISLLLLSGFFSSSETSLFSLSNYNLDKIKQKHPKRGKIIAGLLKNPQKLLVTILICNTFVNIFATLIAVRIFPRVIAVIIVSILILIFGEVAPKTMAINVGEKISTAVAPIFYFLSIILTPFSFLFSFISKIFVSINSFLFYRNVKESTTFHSDEVITVIEESKDHGILNKEESNILGNIVEFADSDISKIAKPRNQIFSIEISTKLTDVIEMIKEKKYSRIPVWENNQENIIGILHAKDILKIKSKTRKLSYYRSILRKPFFVPDSIKAEQLLKKFQTTNSHISLVIDEYGGISGIITLEDLLEEIIGEVVDKDDIKPLYHIYNTSMIEIKGEMEIDEFNEVFNTNLKAEDANTVAGYILEKIKRIPKTGEIITLNNLQFKIAGAAPNKIKNIMVTKIKYKNRGNT